MEGKLVNATDAVGEASFLAMLGEAGFRLSQQPNKDRMRFNNIQFSEQRGELAIEVSAPALSDLDRFKQALGQEGYQVTIGSAVREENSVRGRITMRSNS